MSMNATTLQKDIDTTSIHGITGQGYETGTIRAGALVRNIRDHKDFDGATYRFEASTDGGEHWYTQQSDSRPVVS
jgi:hypothetical protein